MTEQVQSNVIGAGIVGLAVALSLQQSGRRVRLLDRGAPGEDTSFGNAGIVSIASIFPEAEPNIWKALPSMLMRQMAPVTIRLGFLPEFTPWLIRFLRNSTQSRFESNMRSLAALSHRSLEPLEQLLGIAGATDLLRREGMMYIYETEQAFAKARERCDYRRALGQTYELLNPAELKALEPALTAPLAGAIRIPGSAFAVSPLAISRAFFDAFLRQGGEFVQADVTRFETTAGRVDSVVADHAIGGDEFFVTAGAYSNVLTRQLGSPVPLVTERGYHLVLPAPDVEVNNCFICAEKGMAVTPMSDGLRLAGTVEFASLNAPSDDQRAYRLGNAAATLLEGLNLEDGAPWMGRRPSLPDSLPVISSSPLFHNLYFGFGHGHLGLTQAAITGKLLTALASGSQPEVDLAPYRVDRF
ncbi:MAG: FAD-dependent oxidoreductase [Luminiphilus sp.]|nr:FAD-dependent oxidoreductase [Luminiphilus sp.]